MVCLTSLKDVRKVDESCTSIRFLCLIFLVLCPIFVDKCNVHSLSHTKWECKYHIVFAPKYRRKVFYGQKRYEIGQILRELCRWKQVNLLEAEACPDHIHILVEIPPKISVSNFMGFLKGKSSLMIYEKWGNMKYKYSSLQLLRHNKIT